MLHITKVMINAFNITDIDFMGYTVNQDNANYHHLIIPRRNGGVKTINNGAILNMNTSHPYLHVVELRDFELFYLITREMIKENSLRRIDISCIRKIYDYLETFEREHCSDLNVNGEPIIREEFTKRLLK